MVIKHFLNETNLQVISPKKNGLTAPQTDMAMENHHVEEKMHLEMVVFSIVLLVVGGGINQGHSENHSLQFKGY